MKSQLSRDKYCDECGNRYHDSSRNNQGIFCSPDCKRKRSGKQKKKWHKKNYVMVRNRVENLTPPSWTCQECEFKMQLDFDPLNWKSYKKLRDMICPECKSPAIA